MPAPISTPSGAGWTTLASRPILNLVSTLQKTRCTPAEYLALEEKAAYKSQYFDGGIFAMAGESPEHSAITVNVSSALKNHLAGRPCRPYSSDLMISVLPTGLRTYADVSVVCGKPEHDPEVKVAVTNPCVLVEVLSPSTEAFDLGTKASHCRKIPALKCLVYIPSTRSHVQVFERLTDVSWSVRDYSRPEERIHIACLGVELTVEEIYRGVDLPPETLLQAAG